MKKLKNMSLSFLKYKKIYFIFSGTLVLASLVSLLVLGLKPGIDFTGGSILEISYLEERPSNQEVKEGLAELDLGEIYFQPTEEKGLIIRMKNISEETHQKVIESLSLENEIEELRFESIGPVIGRELREKTKIVVILSLLAIVAYIAFSFRKLTFPAKSWQFGLAALVALFHDTLIPLAVFSLLGYFYGIQITISVIVALLTVIGYSINNTVVVFDRIRENLLRKMGATFEETVDISLNQTFTRSINTSLTTIFVLAAIFFLGGETLKYFALTLMIGILAGTYSSLLLVSPILVVWLKWQKKI